MRDDAGDVVGIRLRCPKTARKWAGKGLESWSVLFGRPVGCRAS